jgi:hypothetical protein
MSLGAVKFDSKKNISFKMDDKDCAIDFCEICWHPKGVTMNIFELCPTFDRLDVGELIRDLKSRSESYFKSALEEGQCIANLVIPPNPKMIMELGKHIEEIMKLGDFTITIYDPEKDKRGACLISEDFFESIKEDEDYEGMSNDEIFTNFMMNYAELL